MSNDSQDTYTKDDILAALEDVQGRIAGIHYVLQQARFDEITADNDAMAALAQGSGRVFRKKGC